MLHLIRDSTVTLSRAHLRAGVGSLEVGKHFRGTCDGFVALRRGALEQPLQLLRLLLHARHTRLRLHTAAVVSFFAARPSSRCSCCACASTCRSTCTYRSTCEVWIDGLSSQHVTVSSSVVRVKFGKPFLNNVLSFDHIQLQE